MPYERKPFPARFVVCAVGGTDSEAIDMAKKWVRERGLTQEDVKIVKDEGCILVVTKKEITIRDVQQTV